MNREKCMKNLGNRTALLFVCSPSLGVLDSWLSVLYKLRQSCDAEFIVLVPKSRTIFEVDPDSVIIQIASEVFDTVVYQDKLGNWRKVNSLISAKKEAEGWGSLCRAMFQKNLNIIEYFKRKRIKAICYDLYEESKEYCAPVLSELEGVHRFSIGHGHGIAHHHGTQAQPSILDVDKDCVEKIEKKRRDVTVYLYSERQKPFYDQYNVAPDCYRRVGFPRHDFEWINTLVEKTAVTLPEQFQSNYILLLSRPATTKYFPPDRKRQAVEDIKRIAKKLQKKIIIKPHPKEWKAGKVKDRIYEDVLGKREYGITWIYSNNHVLVLGEKAFLAVFFFSSTASDMVRVSVPVIGRSDLNGLPEYDNKKSERDASGSPVKGYRALGLCLGADDYLSMKKHVQKIVEDRDAVNQQLLSVYDHLFFRKYDVSKSIADEIAAYLL